MEEITDLACELLRRRPPNLEGISIKTEKYGRTTIHTTRITREPTATIIGKPCGTYVNIDTIPYTKSQRVSNLLAAALTNMLPHRGKLLIVGLGNDRFIADSLGPLVLRQIRTSATCLTFQPSVSGVTGIDSGSAIQAVSKLVNPTAVIIIDSLVSASPERIGTNYQICTSGITPGSGLNRNNQAINQARLGVPVLAIGIPICTILTQNTKQLYHVVPKDIDYIVRNCATVIAQAINKLGSRNPNGATKP